MKFTTRMFSLAIAAAMVFAASTAAHAAAFLPGNLVVVALGDGQTALSGNAAATSLQEFTILGTSVQTIALPTAASGASAALTTSGSAGSEGFLELSGNGQYLTLAGYNAAPGTASVTSSVGNRTIGRISLAGVVDTTTVLNDAASIGNSRSAVSNDGTNFWLTSSSGGVRYTTLGSIAASTQINTAAPTNTRVVSINNGQLYMSSASGTYLGVGTVGTGLPTTAGQTPALLPGFPTTGTHSSYDFWFKDANTLYVADDSAFGSGGGIQKWTFSGAAWALQYTLLNTGTATTAVRSLTGTTDGLGNAVLFATTTASSANQLITVVDTGVAAVATTLATAPANVGFRGVEFIPVAVPEPSTFILGGFAVVGLVGFTRRRK